MKGLVIVVALVSFVSTASLSQDKGFGAGVILGEPTGLSAKVWVSQVNAVDFGLAYSFRSRGYLHIHADYLWHFTQVIESTERLPLYVGFGGRIGAGSGRGLFGVRIPAGLAWWIRSAPVELFFELAPIIDLAPSTNFSMNGGIGARYYFR